MFLLNIQYYIARLRKGTTRFKVKRQYNQNLFYYKNLKKDVVQYLTIKYNTNHTIIYRIGLLTKLFKVHHTLQYRKFIY